MRSLTNQEDKMENYEMYGIKWTHMEKVEVLGKSNNESIFLLTEKECEVLGIEVEIQSHAPNYFGE